MAEPQREGDAGAGGGGGGSGSGSGQLTSMMESAAVLVERAKRGVETMQILIQRIEQSGPNHERIATALHQRVRATEASLETTERTLRALKEKMRAASVVMPKQRRPRDTSVEAARVLSAMERYGATTPSVKKPKLANARPLLRSQIAAVVAMIDTPMRISVLDQHVMPGDPAAVILLFALKPVFRAVLRLGSASRSVYTLPEFVINPAIGAPSVPSDALAPIDAATHPYSVSEAALVRFELPETAVFRLLTERASTAARHFWFASESGSDALLSFMRWLALHQSIFRDASHADGSRVKFDTSRGAFLPPVIHSFDLENNVPLHPRTCLPQSSGSRAGRPQSSTPIDANQVGGAGVGVGTGGSGAQVSSVSAAPPGQVPLQVPPRPVGIPASQVRPG
ncbi:hypothetical protein FVE85_9234 [Porphyridium purpureum]|uniref:Uncharacterized protein n=1 Tax=Porphyridium purpureum TaxID=35688 RepID=A0A5J4YQ07_PORPP|nr:hypothetical protein FVE85_9234 [Porphyridium purpureum]|eukprot:POR8678..scf222_8